MRALIAKPENWTKDFFARDINDISCSSKSNEAVKWCLLGAFSRIKNKDYFVNTAARCYEIMCSLVKKRGFAYISVFNDNSTHEEVIDLLNEAIQVSREKYGD